MLVVVAAAPAGEWEAGCVVALAGSAAPADATAAAARVIPTPIAHGIRVELDGSLDRSFTVEVARQPRAAPSLQERKAGAPPAPRTGWSSAWCSQHGELGCEERVQGVWRARISWPSARRAPPGKDLAALKASAEACLAAAVATDRPEPPLGPPPPRVERCRQGLQALSPEALVQVDAMRVDVLDKAVTADQLWLRWPGRVDGLVTLFREPAWDRRSGWTGIGDDVRGTWGKSMRAPTLQVELLAADGLAAAATADALARAERALSSCR